MDSLYQLRKDIDELYSKFFDVDNGEWNISSKEELDAIIERLNSDNSLEVLETNLSSFSEDLDNFRTSLISFNEDLTEYSGELSDFGGELTGFTGTLDDLEVWLYGKGGTYVDPDDGQTKPCTPEHPCSSSIKGELANLHDLLVQLQTGDGIVLDNLATLKDHLTSFSGSLQDFKDYLEEQGVDTSVLDNTVLSLILEINKNIYDISDHEQRIGAVDEAIGVESDPEQGVVATGIFARLEEGEDLMGKTSEKAEALEITVNGDPDDDEDFGLVGKTGDLIETVGEPASGGQPATGLIGQVTDVIDEIGEPSSGGQSATGLHLAIENAQGTADAVDGVATNIKKKIGYNSIPDESPLQSQIIAQGGRITGAEGDISDLGDMVGDVDVSTDGDLQSQINGIRSVIQNNNENQAIWVFGDVTPPTQTWLIMMYDYGIDVDNIHYGYSITTHQGFVRTGSTWTQYDIDELNELVDFATGVAYDVRDVSTVTEDEVWDTMLSLSYDVFYVKENGSWVVTNGEYPYKRNAVYTLTDWLSGSYNNIPVGDYKCQHRINREINSVLGEKTNIAFRLKETITKNGATAKIYANNGFVYIKYSGTVSLTANTNLNMGTLTDTSYAPIDYEYAPINHVGSDIGIYGAINDSGMVYVINDSSRTSVTLHGGIMYPLTSNIYDI